MIDGVVILDKPRGITSFRAVEKVGRILRQKKCGHAGTLDPMATGVLPICAGRATKIAGYIAAQDKDYDVSFRFGIATDTGDVTGREVESLPGGHAGREAVEAAVSALVGSWEQVPPAYSAVKVAGKRAYALARQGKTVELAARPVTVSEARVVSWSPEGFRLFIRCTKGFYVRALARDLGKALGAPMAVSELRRLRCGPFRAEDAVTLEALAGAAARGESGTMTLTIGRALEGFPKLAIPAEAADAVRHGRSPAPWLAGKASVAAGGIVLLTRGDGEPVALVARGAGGEWTIVRGI